jgi:CRP-like cAMP-binding protein
MEQEQQQSIKDRIRLFDQSVSFPPENMPNVVRVALTRKDGVFRPRKPISRTEKLEMRKELVREKDQSRRNLLEEIETSPEVPEQAPELSTLAPLPDCQDRSRGLIRRKSSRDGMCSAVGNVPENVYRRQPIKSTRAPPKFTRSTLESDVIQTALEENFVFKDLTRQQLTPFIAAFDRKTFEQGEKITEQGDPADYFYIIERGAVVFEVNGIEVGTAGGGSSFGELALIYSSPRAATVVALERTSVFRVEREIFSSILQSQAEKSEDSKISILRKVIFLKDLTDSDLKKLAMAMTPMFFERGELLIRKGDVGEDFFILEEGEVLVRDISMGSTVYEDVTLGPGEYFGERALAKSEPCEANVSSTKKGMAFKIKFITFNKVLGKMSKLILKAQDTRKLAGVKALSEANLEPSQIASLASMITNRIFKEGKNIFKEGKHIEPALYFVREGKVLLKSSNFEREVSDDGYFGLEKIPLPKNSIYQATCKSVCVIGVLTLANFRQVFDTQFLEGAAQEEVYSCSTTAELPSLKLEALRKYQILGEGNFGQVWLVTESESSSTPYALKIQAKFELIEGGQADTVLREKEIMSQVRHPFISNLVKTHQDTDFLYMLLDYAQGGELFNAIHADDHDGLPEENCQFYACVIAEALAYMHRRFIAFRDLKPENVVIDKSGYPVLIDFGYAKYIPEKSFTLCGTPNYLSPEMITSRGHSCSVDHWALGVITYEALTGLNPFFEEGMDQTTLYKSIVQDHYPYPDEASAIAADFIEKLLIKDPNQRLGSLAGGEDDLFAHEWLERFDLERLRKRELVAPWVPECRDALDTSNFADWSDVGDKTIEKYPPLSLKDQNLFEGF